MKIKTLNIEGFKRFQAAQSFDFDRPITVITGENGSGKTSILQAIASVLGTATKTLTKPSQLGWNGYNYSLLSGGKYPKIALDITFAPQELAAISLLHQKTKDNGKVAGVVPNRENHVSIALNYDEDKVDANTRNVLAQFNGYHFAKQLTALNTGTKSFFEQVGSIFWYSAERNNNSFRSFIGKAKEDIMRDFLLSRYRFHQRIKYDNLPLKNDQRDIFAELAEMYHKVFSDRILSGAEPRNNFEDTYKPDWFFLTEGENKYEISEMSAGEQAIFPILADFANLRINNSIILIDEIELHLHPPLQQGFFRTIQQLGHNNQFIITTHADAIVSIVAEENIIRL